MLLMNEELPGGWTMYLELDMDEENPVSITISQGDRVVGAERIDEAFIGGAIHMSITAFNKLTDYRYFITPTGSLEPRGV